MGKGLDWLSKKIKSDMEAEENRQEEKGAMGADKNVSYVHRTYLRSVGRNSRERYLGLYRRRGGEVYTGVLPAGGKEYNEVLKVLLP